MVDLLIIDWLIVATIRPTFIMVPCTEELKGYSDYGFPFRAFLKGLVGSLIASLVIAASRPKNRPASLGPKYASPG